MTQTTRRQPISQHLLEVQNHFKSKYHLDPMNSTGYKTLVSDESAQDVLIGLASAQVGDEKIARVFKSLAKRSAQGEQNAFVSDEGLDVAGVNANYSPMPELNVYTILGYIARCDVMDLYHVVEGEKATLTFNYDHSYMTKGMTGTKFSLPEAIRDGSIADLTKLPEAIPLDSPDLPHLETLNIGVGLPATGSSVWIKLGAAGNLLNEAGYPAGKHTLERNIKVAYLRGTWGGSNTVFTVEVDVDRAYQTDEKSSVRVFNQYIEDFEYDTTGHAKVSFFVVGRIDLDSGAYTITTSGVSTSAVTFSHFKFGDARVTNIAKEMATLRPGNETFNVTLDVENKLTMAVPLTPETLDDFRTATGVDYVTAAVDIISEFYVGVRSVDMENELDKAYARGALKHKLSPKLGGFKDAFNFPLNVRGPGGEDPYSWAEKGLKRTITNMLVNAHYDLKIPNNTPFEWTVYGPEKDTQWLLGVNYMTQENGKAPEAAVRYGFTFGSTYGYTDNYGRRLKVIGNQDKRMKDKGLQFNLKVDSMKAPFGIYYPYAFRVYKGKAAEYAMLDAINVYQRDKLTFLSSAQARVTLEGNDYDLFGAISQYSANHA